MTQIILDMTTHTKQDRTRVCALDLNKDLVAYLQQRFEVFEGSLGKKVLAKYGKYDSSCRFLLNYNLPVNIHEYEIFIEDMCRDDEQEYHKEDHTRTYLECDKAYYFYCYQPQTIFNPICYGSHIFADKIRKHRDRPTIKIVFASEKENIHYLIHNEHDCYDSSNENHTNYEHLHLPQSDNICGAQVKLSENQISAEIFQSFLSDVRYHIAFDIPYKWHSQEKNVEDGFIPLLETPSGAIVSFAWITDYEISIVLPQTSRKVELLQKVFDELLFRHFSKYFPEVAESAWINNTAYYLPNQESLLQQKDAITAKYKEDIANINQQIESNNQQFAFLHSLLTATGDKLVKATIQFFQWLGFSNVIDKDENLDKNFNEEDIQIDVSDNPVNDINLLVIEVKGIGGTSTDAQCSQISKVVHRRGKERKAYDVHGLYIVNNELHKEPLHRTIPPFNETQIGDAVNDERGLCYTWQLFNLYFNIESGIITKEEARTAFFKNGLLTFEPDFIRLGIPHDYYRNRTVVSFKIEGTKICIGDSFYYEKDGRWYSARVESIKDGPKSYDSVESGDYGFGLSCKVPNNTPLFISNKQ